MTAPTSRSTLSSRRASSRTRRIDVKILGEGELKKKLAVTAHLFSKTAREKIESAGGTATALREPVEKKRKTRKAKPVADEAEPETETEEAAEAQEAPADEAEEVSSEESASADSEE